jgi:septal ring factor EnvC (AmiA/AmiB activator)
MAAPRAGRAAPGKDVPVSDGFLAGSVLELAQTLTKNNAVLKERMEERVRLNKIAADFKTHLAWQRQRKQTLKHNLERLHNEAIWLDNKAGEVATDVSLVGNELRQVNDELARLRREVEARKR